MNIQAKTGKGNINWRKIIPVVIILLIAGYLGGEPYLEKWLGVDLPPINDAKQVAESQQPKANGPTADSPNFNPNVKPDSATPKARDSSSLRSADPRADGSQQTKSKPASSSSTAKFKLQELGGDKFKSPAGLIYRRSSHGEHRIDHVMRHARDDPNRRVHGVFDGDKQQILAMIDDAYEMAEGGSKRVKKETNPDKPYRVTYVVDMQRRIGFKGGRSGKRDRFPPLTKLRIVIDNGNQVITAYPDD